MMAGETQDKLRIRSAEELTKQMEGLVVLKTVLNTTLDRWFLSGGTLLGACREGDFIPWDWDVEITLLTEEAYEKVGDLLGNLLEAGFEISKCNFSFENLKINALGWGARYEIQGRYLNEEQGLRARVLTQVPARFFETTEMVALRGHNFPAPSPIENFLAALYGDWKTPIRTADKQRYLSPSTYRKKSAGWINRRKTQLGKLLWPAQVQEFPKVLREQLDLFDRWDCDLGWCNLHNRTQIDKSNNSSNTCDGLSGLTILSTDDNGSRSCSHPTGRAEVSIYGDGFAMCRDVQDHETFAWNLGELSGTRISNYGVGGYGLDQALLLMEREYSQDPSDAVVLAVTSITMARCVSVYRHYIKPDEILAIKPRFRLGESDDGLHLVKYPIAKMEQLLSLSEYREHFRANDEHYGLWRKSRIDYYIRQLPKKVAARVGIGPNPSPYKTFEYEVSFWKSHEALFLGMMAFYQQLADRHGFKPVFFLQHPKRSLEYLTGKAAEQLPWTSAMARAMEQFPGITFLYEADIFAERDDIEALYTRSHHSPKANRMIADYLNTYI